MPSDVVIQGWTFPDWSLEAKDPWAEAKTKSGRVYLTRNTYDGDDVEIEATEDVRLVWVPVEVMAEFLRRCGYVVEPAAKGGTDHG